MLRFREVLFALVEQSPPSMFSVREDAKMVELRSCSRTMLKKMSLRWLRMEHRSHLRCVRHLDLAFQKRNEE